MRLAPDAGREDGQRGEIDESIVCCEALAMANSVTPERLPLFVFGTLRRGHRNHHYLAGHYERVVAANLCGYARLHELMIARRPGGVVDGELFFLNLDEYDSTMAGCDELEEIPAGQLVGHEYQRKRVTVETAEGRIEAWAYVQPEQD
jgi:gamma-glutamylcyclotransferase (GGCT)/AIG2-like uncharacterized protein YtfP